MRTEETMWREVGEVRGYSVPEVVVDRRGEVVEVGRRELSYGELADRCRDLEARNRDLFADWVDAVSESTEARRREGILRAELAEVRGFVERLMSFEFSTHSCGGGCPAYGGCSSSRRCEFPDWAMSRARELGVATPGSEGQKLRD